MVLLLSWLLYFLNSYLHLRITPGAFERPFPLLTWQVLFFTAIVAGWYKEKIFHFFSSKAGSATLMVVVAVFLLLMFYSWNNPWEPVPYHARLHLVREKPFTKIYALFFQRTFLGLGRIANVMIFLICSYLLLTFLWQPIRRWFGWFFVSVGQASLYVFVIHVLLSLLCHDISYFQHSTVKFNTLIHTIILLLVWLMVRYRILFSIIPR